TTSYTYDATTNRLVSVIQSGYTQTYSPSVGFSSPILMNVARFYFTHTKCTTTGSDDPFGPVVAVHGPCFVTDPNQADCNVNTSAGVPVTQYTYYGATGDANANRIQYVKRYTANTGPTGCSGQPYLQTSFSNYNTQGYPGQITGPSGVASALQYEDSRVTKVT